MFKKKLFKPGDRIRHISPEGYEGSTIYTVTGTIPDGKPTPYGEVNRSGKPLIRCQDPTKTVHIFPADKVRPL